MSILDQRDLVALNLPTSIRFNAGSYRVNDPEMLNFINLLSLTIDKMPPSVKVEG